ncbi:MAG TPA: Hsp20 family protein [Terriglobia bacterium]|nr:Hsp20 family protein [Terriglobia bacterium]
MLKQSISVTRVNDTVSRERGQVSDRLKEVHNLISRRAFEIYEASGRSCGHELDHWFQAESELLQATPVQIRDSDGALIVRAEVPGFKAHEIEVMVEPRRLTVVGMRGRNDKHKPDKLIPSQAGTSRILRVIGFPQLVDTEAVTANLKDGVLKLTLPKAAVGSEPAAKSRAAWPAVGRTDATNMPEVVGS